MPDHFINDPATFQLFLFQLYKGFFIVALFSGVLLVVQPPFLFPDEEGKGYVEHDFTYFMGALLALSAAVFGGVNNIIISGEGIHERR